MFKDATIPLKCIINNRGPRIEPCGTPQLTGLKEDCSPFTETQANDVGLHPTDDIFFTFYAVSSHTLVEVYQIGQQGRRKHQKVGGGAFSRGTFRMKMAPKKISPEMLARGG